MAPCSKEMLPRRMPEGARGWEHPGIQVPWGPPQGLQPEARIAGHQDLPGLSVPNALLNQKLISASSLQNWEMINFCCVSPSVFDTFGGVALAH